MLDLLKLFYCLYPSDGPPPLPPELDDEELSISLTSFTSPTVHLDFFSCDES